MQQHRELSLWLVTLIGCSAAASVACGDDVGDLNPGGISGTATSAGTGSGGSAGAGTASGGSATSGAPTTMAGTTSTAGTASGGMSGGAGGSSSGGMSGGTGGSSSGGMSGGTGGSAGGGNMPYGIVSCQPAFEVACKPNIVFDNQDPTGRGKAFNDTVPDVVGTMKNIACTACSILYRNPSEIPQNKHPSQIKLVLDTHGGVAQAGGDQIQFDLNYIDGQRKSSDDAEFKQEMLGVLQHETVHLYQNYGTGGTGEGLADLVRARTGYYPQSRWRSEGTWKTAYTASGNFYSWLTGPCTFHSKAYSQHDFDLPYKINKALTGKSGDTASFDAVASLLQMTFGKDVDTLWDEYQADAYGK
jgi:hypothetical protein